jgi:hypothetical protein
MSADTGKEFAVEVPQIGKKLTCKACFMCQEKAKTHDLHICLGCKSMSWYPSGDFRSRGISYHVKFRCNNCVTAAISQTLTVKGAGV